MEKYRDMRHIYFENTGNREKVKSILDARYHSEATIRLPFSVGEYPAFLMFNNELVSLISSIYQANQKLERLVAALPKEAVHQFRGNMMVEEIQQTNEVENVHSTRKEIRDAIQAMNEGRTGKRFAGMVRKYDMLIAEKNIPLRSSIDIRKLYDEFILDEVVRENPDNAPDGLIFRKEITSVYSGSDQKLHDGLAPEEKIIEVMEQALSVLNDDSINSLIRVALFHYMFAYIHPFYDGNGRMTRFISSYVLSKDFDKSACLRIAFVIKDHRPKYYKMFKEANDKRSMGELTAFVTDFLLFFKQAIDDSYQSLNEKKKRYERYRMLFARAITQQYADIPDRYRALFDVMLITELFGHPRFSIKVIADALECNQRTARNMLEKCGSLVYHTNEGRKYWWHINLDEVERMAQDET